MRMPTRLVTEIKGKQSRLVYTGFDVALVKSGSVQKKETRPGTYKVVVDEWLKGDIGGGGPEITMKNYNGDIYVRKK